MREIKFKCLYDNKIYDVTNIDFDHGTINLCGADIIKFEDGTLIQCVRTKR